MPGPNRDLHKGRRAVYATQALEGQLHGENPGGHNLKIAKREVYNQVMGGYPRADPKEFYTRAIIEKLRGR